jgi:hypothetical protein
MFHNLYVVHINIERRFKEQCVICFMYIRIILNALEVLLSPSSVHIDEKTNKYSVKRLYILKH